MLMQTATIYYTSDTHGGVFPSPNGSLSQCISQFPTDGNTLILDGGDTIQGAPLLRYLWENNCFAQSIPWFFNRGGYQAYTLGNHDFNYGYEGLSQFVTAMDAQCICANVTDQTGQLPLVDYHIFTLENGLRLGITGVVTSWVNVWEPAENLTNLVVSDGFIAAKQALSAMKDKCDVTICIYHGGFEEDLDTGAILKTTDENLACKFARELDFDLLLTGHQHAKHENRTLHGTHTLQPPANAIQYGKISIVKSPAGLDITSQLCTPTAYVAPDVAEHVAQLQEASHRWLGQVLGSLCEDVPVVDKIRQAVHGSKISDLVNQIQLQATGAEIACTSLHNAPVSLPKEVTVGDVLRLAPYPNGVVVKAISGKALLAGLERSASYFALNDGKLAVSPTFLVPKEEHYLYDYFANVTYTVVLGTPNQVRNVMINGEPLDLQRTYTVAMSDYRATGAGGYEAYASCPVVQTVEADIQQLLLAHLKGAVSLEIASLSQVTVIR